ncbi:MAG: hypothetical protein EZS28_014359 [Streblomastix strix]|uniref:Uncharacterized protein n=1 Tax=Streblomastix strix TaxID=222440 RepID=A0A5J4W5S0_9EUKA|nr:MAG: hypothetical protein EZS28_014359 [Streblomastix strix]
MAGAQSTGNDKEKMKLLMSGLMSCHFIVYINRKYVGDPLDVMMLKFIKWKFKDVDNIKKKEDNQKKKKSKKILKEKPNK